MPRSVEKALFKSKFSHAEAKRLKGKVPVKEVEADLPPGFIADTSSHPLHADIMRGKDRELQDMLHIPVCGPPQKLPKGHKAIGLMWVLTCKGDDAQMYARVKARLCLMGNQERDSLSKWMLYAPVAHPTTYLLLVPIHIGQKGVYFRQYDISQAYLSTMMKREVYVSHPPGFEVLVDSKGRLIYRELPKGHKPTTVMRLYRALYGGGECGRLFYDAFVDWHVAYGFPPSAHWTNAS